MTSFNDFTNSFLREFQQYYSQRDIVNHWAEPTEESPYPSLILRFDEIGEQNSLIDLELCFLPGLESFSQEGIYILQSFAVIKNNVSPRVYAKLLEEIAKINIQLPLGGFGLFTDTGDLYFKHNTIQNLDWLSSPIALEHFDRQNALVVHQFYQFTDALLDLAGDSQH
ncbi:hypothetical protein [Paenibacillus radicis (ex Xue et al. 2023)]|uniref:Uncharacterized protein n=1 Tax=Paenibacillus radicis (ex Xue et al. 2023) TaxID=2972489 RepID=A0ABT1YBW7_9BACL|nr:hypothetical protein [Paenibacillus radicis (ex Xue et al. 2023)]MCR8630402.1 hypothetical protein [Paenibacillus radicis (ex Xue et al. 2023)]